MNERLATLVDSVVAVQTKVKQLIDATENKKQKAAASAYWDKLEAFRLTLVPPVMKGTGEFVRLRSEISQIYAAVAGQETAPGNLQLQRVQLLSAKLDKENQAFEELQKKYGAVLQSPK